MTIVTVGNGSGPPLRVSASGRYLVDHTGASFLLCGDSVWSAIAQLTNAQIDTYLADRQAKGFNAVIVNLLEHKFADHAPNNIDNVSPWNTTIWTQPNDTYFQRADYLLTQAAARGMVVLLNPLYLGIAGNGEGWDAEVGASSAAAMISFGTYVGSRYKGITNIVWLLGTDYEPKSNATVESRFLSFVSALVTADPNHLMTFQGLRGDLSDSAANWTAGTPAWVNINSAYPTDLTTPGLVQSAYQDATTRPALAIECYYEGEHSMTTQGVRAEAYWSILGGGCGHFFGNNPLWETGYGGTDWMTAMGAAGSLSMVKVWSLFKALAWWTLVPDWAHVFLTVGYGTLGNADYATAAKDASGHLALVYMPSNRTMTVDVSQMAGTITADWYDPLDGTFTADAASPLANTGTHNFSRATANSGGAADWVLRLRA